MMFGECINRNQQTVTGTCIAGFAVILVFVSIDLLFMAENFWSPCWSWWLLLSLGDSPAEAWLFLLGHALTADSCLLS